MFLAESKNRRKEQTTPPRKAEMKTLPPFLPPSPDFGIGSFFEIFVMQDSVAESSFYSSLRIGGPMTEFLQFHDVPRQTACTSAQFLPPMARSLSSYHLVCMLPVTNFCAGSTACLPPN